MATRQRAIAPTLVACVVRGSGSVQVAVTVLLLQIVVVEHLPMTGTMFFFYVFIRAISESLGTDPAQISSRSTVVFLRFIFELPLHLHETANGD